VGKSLYLMTSESVSEGHPDKMADQISDAILDAIISEDKTCRVAVETLVKTGLVVIAGEITTTAEIDYEEVTRNTIENIGYNREELGFDHKSCEVLSAISKQSPEIAMGVDRDAEKNQGAGAGRNYVITKAKGDFIALLDADDLWFPFYLEEQYRLINKYPNKSVFTTAQEIIKENKCYPRTYSILLSKGEDGVLNYFKSSKLDSIIHSSSVVIKKDLFDVIGLFNPTIKSGQDTDLWIRIGLETSIVFSTKICSKYNFINNSLFRSTTSMDQKIDLTPYEIYENTNLDLKVFLDLNRYSLALQAKLWGDKKSFTSLISKIDFNNLNKKQRFLLKQNKVSLKALKTTQNILKKWFNVSAFK